MFKNVMSTMVVYFVKVEYVFYKFFVQRSTYE